MLLPRNALDQQSASERRLNGFHHLVDVSICFLFILLTFRIGWLHRFTNNSFFLQSVQDLLCSEMKHEVELREEQMARKEAKDKASMFKQEATSLKKFNKAKAEEMRAELKKSQDLVNEVNAQRDEALK